jgi:hypothetical protein
MRDSNRPTNRSGGGKGPLIIVIAGLVVLIGAGLVLYKKRFAAPNPTVRENHFVKKKVAAPPLVITEPVKPGNGNWKDKDDRSPDSDRAPRSEPLGTINASLVNDFINARFGQVKACYERRLRVDASLEGKLDLNISISSGGRVTGVAVNKDTVKDSQMLSCVRGTIRQWNFPKPQNGRVVVAKTFLFKKKSS